MSSKRKNVFFLKNQKKGYFFASDYRTFLGFYLDCWHDENITLRKGGYTAHVEMIRSAVDVAEEEEFREVWSGLCSEDLRR